MGKLLVYATTKDELNRNISDEARRLKQEDMTGKLTINAALRQAKEMYLRNESEKATKNPDQSVQSSIAKQPR